MKFRKVIFSTVFFVVLLLSMELLIRIVFACYGYPFIRPGNYIHTGFYPIIEEVINEDAPAEKNVRNILILGGSVISTPWSHMEARLDTILQKKYGRKSKFAFYNVAVAGHTSLDNLIKYRLIKDKHFDLVIYYEAINENRANCIPEQDYRDDYGHIKWYSNIHRLQNHPEINYTIIPYAFDLLRGAVWDIATRRNYASQTDVEPEMVNYGRNIKTAGAYRNNISSIIALAKKRQEKLLLVKYASYFPKGVRLTGKEEDRQYYSCCDYASPVSQWGDAENVKKGIFIHNEILTQLAKKHQNYFLDMAGKMPQDGKYFRDVCHLSKPGVQKFANELSSYIIQEKLLE